MRSGSLAKRLVPYLLVAPAALVVSAVLVYPMVNVTWMSFFTWPFAQPEMAEFAGVENYASLLRDDLFWSASSFTLIFTVATLAVEFTVALGAALVLDGLRRGRGLVMSIAVAPYMVAPIAVGLIWRFMFQRDIGIINYGLSFAGVEPISWLSDALPALTAVVIADSWQSMPFMLLILLAGLTAIPDDLPEAAKIDGASELGVIRHLKIPLLAPYIAIALIFETVFKLRIFDLVVTLTRGGPGSDTTPVGLLIQRLFFRYFNGGEAAAASVLLLLAGGLVAFVYLRWVYREIEY